MQSKACNRKHGAKKKNRNFWGGADHGGKWPFLEPKTGPFPHILQSKRALSWSFGHFFLDPPRSDLRVTGGGGHGGRVEHGAALPLCHQSYQSINESYWKGIVWKRPLIQTRMATMMGNTLCGKRAICELHLRLACSLHHCELRVENQLGMVPVNTCK